MRKMKKSEIIKKTDSLEARAREEKIRRFVSSQPGYTPGRKRPKDPDEARILELLR